MLPKTCCSPVLVSLLLLCAVCTQLAGCQSSRNAVRSTTSAEPRADEAVETIANRHAISLTGYQDGETVPGDADPAVHDAESEDIDFPSEPEPEVNQLPALVATAQASNPKLLRLQQEANAAWARVRYVDELPDPTIGVNVFGNPIETAAGSQRANLTLMQMIPWLDRLDAQEQQACFEAMALQQNYHAERLRVIGDVRATYYRLYILIRQIETVEANQQLLEALVEIVNARVATGQATQGDVLLGTLELSRLEEQLITLRQQVASTTAQINRLLNRPVDVAISVPEELDARSPEWSHAFLVQTAFDRQPVIAAAQLQASASRWGVEVAELRRRPDFQVGASWFFIEGNRPPSRVVNVGEDAWSVGATMSIPLWREKYDAIRDEALWKHAATNANIEDVLREFDARLLDLLEQARAAERTAQLYQTTIIPQAEQTLRADQESLTDGTVEFDRVIQDFRNLLTLEFGYHRSVGELATAIARIRQTVGIDLEPTSDEFLNPPAPGGDRSEDIDDAAK